MAREIVIFSGTNAVDFKGQGTFSEPDYNGRTDVDLDPNLSAVVGFHFKYWTRQSPGVYVLKSQGARDAIDAAEAAAITAANRSLADTIKDDLGPDGIKWRALALMLLDEFNDLRQWIAAFKIQTAAATNLANFQSRVASLPSMPDRTIAQVKTAYSNKTAGPADS